MKLPHIFLTNNSNSYKYSRNNSFSKKINIKDKEEHVKRLQDEYTNAINAAIAIKKREKTNLSGFYIDFYSQESVDFGNLENKTKKITLLSLNKDKNKVSKATVYIPDGKDDYFTKKFKNYQETIDESSIKNKDLVESIEHITISDVNSFWSSDSEDLPNTEKIWCEMWVRNVIDNEDWSNVIRIVKKCLDSLNINYKHKYITFPERCVLLIQANKDMLISLINNCDYLAELRKFYEPNDFFMTLNRKDLNDFVSDLRSRISINKISNTSVCLLDTGININHLLLKDSIISAKSFFKNRYKSPRFKRTWVRNGWYYSL